MAGIHTNIQKTTNHNENLHCIYCQVHDKQGHGFVMFTWMYTEDMR